MEAAKTETSPGVEEAGQPSGNRSFKSKLLVRSQAIRESQSPPRAASPPAGDAARADGAASPCAGTASPCAGAGPCAAPSDAQVKGGGAGGGRRRCAARAELLGGGPRVACVCGRRARACIHCRGRRKLGGAGACPTKQDSGIGCSQDCPECAASPDIFVSPADDPLEQSQPPSSQKTENPDDAEICRCQDNKKDCIPKMASLGRTDSEEKKELTADQLVVFLRDTLNKNVKDRVSLLKIERDLVALVNDPGRCVVRFPAVTSYGRMLIHRCAQLFELKHTLDHNSKNTVMVSKTGTCGGRIPCTSFRQWCTTVFPPSPHRQQDATQAKSILKRDAHSLDDAMSGHAAQGSAAARSKSFEQREEEYERVRRRIFSSEDGQTEDGQWPWLPSGPVKLLTPESTTKGSRLLKVQSLEGQQGLPAARGAVSKSHSFGGYGRDEPQPRILSRQGDLASSSWRLSPSSSGYKTLSFRSTDSVTPSPTGGVSPEPCAVAAPAQDGGGGGGGALVWAVTDLSSVPPGALILHPQTGRPLTNADGSLYRYEPARPPPAPEAAPAQPARGQTEQNPEKRRGRLEKQNSFIDPDCECQSDGYLNDSCCNCCEAKSQIDWSYQCYHTKQEVIGQPKIKNQPYYSQKPQDQTSPQTNNLKTNTIAEKTTSPKLPERSMYEPTNEQTAANHVQSNQIQNKRPASQGSDLANRTAGLENYSSQVIGVTDVKRTESDSCYIYPSDYGSNVTNEMMHYSLPYYGNQSYRTNEEFQVQLQQQSVNSPGFIQELTIQHMVQQNKPVTAAYDPTLRPQMSLSGMMYQPNMNQPGYPYTNHCRIETPLHQPPPYGAPQEPGGGEHKMASPQLEPAYAYAPACCAADPARCLPQQGSFGLAYGASLEQQIAQPAPYPLAGMLLQQHAAPPPQPPAVHPYQFATPNQWATAWQPTMIATPAPLQRPPTPPGLYAPPPEAPLYQLAGYRGLYPQLQYPALAYPCQRLYAGAAQRARAEVGRATPQGRLYAPPAPQEEAQKPAQMYSAAAAEAEAEAERRGAAGGAAEIACAVRRIEERMARLGSAAPARDRPPSECKSEAARRGGGGGLLGSHPAAHDVAQLTPAARAIVDSLLGKQSRAHANAFHHENARRRYEHGAQQPERSPGGQQRARRPRSPRRPRGDVGAPEEARDRAQVAEKRQAVPECGPPPPHYQYDRPYVLRQVTAGAWCRRSPGPLQPAGFNPRYGPRRPGPDTRRR